MRPRESSNVFLTREHPLIYLRSVGALKPETLTPYGAIQLDHDALPFGVKSHRVKEVPLRHHNLPFLTGLQGHTSYRMMCQEKK